jgi:hypothetical protein
VTYCIRCLASLDDKSNDTIFKSWCEKLNVLIDFRSHDHTYLSISGQPVSRQVRIKIYLLDYNLFETSNSTANTRWQELISTRIYLTLLIVTAIIIFLYGGLKDNVKQEKVMVSSHSFYEQLQRLYLHTLQCPCLNASVSYGTFIPQLHTTMHPVCSSFLISNEWMTDFRNLVNVRSDLFNPRDFRLQGTLYFQLLSTLCSKANSTIIDAIDQFRSNSFLSTELIPRIQFQLQIGQQIEAFKRSIETQFSRSLQVFRASAQGNGLISLSGSNVLLSYINSPMNSSFTYAPKLYNNGTCSCATSSACFQSAIMSNKNASIVYTMDTILVGCFTLDSIIFSSLSCFFSNSCLTDFIQGCAIDRRRVGSTLFPKSEQFLSIMNLPSNSRYEINDTIETMVSNLFIDIWSSETSFEQYYNACAPTYCTYTRNERPDIVSTLTTFLNLYYGTVTALRFIVPYLIKFTFELWILISN